MTLAPQWDKIIEALGVSGGEGLTLDEIHILTDVPAASASAAIRDMRTRGGIGVLSLPPSGGRGPWRYTLERSSQCST